MSEPTREERIAAAVWALRGTLGDARRDAADALEAAGLDALLAERDWLRERAEKAEVEIACIKDEAHRADAGTIIRSWSEDIALRENAERAASAFAQTLRRVAGSTDRPFLGYDGKLAASILDDFPDWEPAPGESPGSNDP